MVLRDFFSQIKVKISLFLLSLFSAFPVAAMLFIAKFGSDPNYVGQLKIIGFTIAILIVLFVVLESVWMTAQINREKFDYIITKQLSSVIILLIIIFFVSMAVINVLWGDPGLEVFLYIVYLFVIFVFIATTILPLIWGWWCLLFGEKKMALILFGCVIFVNIIFYYRLSVNVRVCIPGTTNCHALQAIENDKANYCNLATEPENCVIRYAVAKKDWDKCRTGFYAIGNYSYYTDNRSPFEDKQYSKCFMTVAEETNNFLICTVIENDPFLKDAVSLATECRYRVVLKSRECQKLYRYEKEDFTIFNCMHGIIKSKA